MCGERMSWMMLAMGCSGALEYDDWTPADTGWSMDEVEQADVVAQGLEGPVGIAWWQQQLFVAEEDAGRVVSLDEEEAWLEGLEGPSWLSAEGDWMLVADTTSVHVLGSDGSGVTLSEGHESIGRIELVDGVAWWLDPDAGELWMAELPDGEAVRITDGLAVPVGLSVLDGAPWVAEQDDELLIEIDPETGEQSTVAELEDPPHDLVREGEDAFLTTRSTRWPYGGFILAVSDGDVDEISYSPPEPERIGLDTDYVIWTSKQSITRVSRQGGTYELVSGMTAVEDFVSVDGFVYWTDGQTGEVLSW